MGDAHHNKVADVESSVTKHILWERVDHPLLERFDVSRRECALRGVRRYTERLSEQHRGVCGARRTVSTTPCMHISVQ